MKIRFDFVTNSSSSSFVCVQFKSKKLKELLEKYDVQYWKSNSKWDVYYKDEDVSCTAVAQNNIGRTLDWFMEELLLMMNDGNEYINEYRENKQMYVSDITEAVYKIDDTKYGEFEESEENHDTFKYIKGKISDKIIYESLSNLKNRYSISSFRPVNRDQYLGELHLKQATTNSDISLVRDPYKADDPNAVFAEIVPHKYIGYFWDEISENLAPILDSGKYLYRTKFDIESRGIQIEFEKTGCNKAGWKRIKSGSPQITNEEYDDVKKAFNRWIIDLKTKYEEQRVPSSLSTILKSGDEDPFVVKQWCKALYNEDIEIVLSREGLLKSKTKSGIDLTRWNKGDESDQDYYLRIMSALEERQVTQIREIDFRGKVFVNRTNRYGGWSQTDGNNPIVLTFRKAGGIHNTAVNSKTDYLIAGLTESNPQRVDRKWVDALKLIDKGAKIKIILLKQLETEIGLNEKEARESLRLRFQGTRDADYYYVRIGSQIE